MSTTLAQFARFALVGTIGFLTDVTVLVIGMRLGAGPYIARVISFLCAAAVTWLLNRSFTFRTGPAVKSAEPLKYLAAMTAGGAANYSSYSLVVALFPHEPLAPVAGVAIGSIVGMGLNFAGAKWWVFNA